MTIANRNVITIFSTNEQYGIKNFFHVFRTTNYGKVDLMRCLFTFEYFNEIFASYNV